jgi:hypothetical protein
VPKFLDVTDKAAAREYLGVNWRAVTTPIPINVLDYGAVGDGASHDAGSVFGLGLNELRENYWTGVRFADDDGVIIFDPQFGSGTIYVSAGGESAHFTYNTTTGVITETSGSGGIAIGSGVLTGTTGVDGAITLSGTNSVIYVENRSGARISVKWSEALTTDEADLVAIQHALAYATLVADESGGISEVLIPSGTYLCDRAIYVYSNTKMSNNGHLKFTGGNAVGGFVWIQRADNVELTGGIWDSNFQTNDNTIGVTHVSANQTVIGSVSTNVMIHDLIVQNARHGGSHLADITDPTKVGGGGGKGITIQHGASGVLISNVIMDDCDLGLSIEGKESGGGYANSVVVENLHIKNCRYMAIFLTSVQNTVSLYGKTASVLLNNIDIVDCAVNQTIDATPQDISDLFGVITFQSMVGVKATGIRIRSTTGKMTAFRGATRHSEWDVQIIAAGEIVDVVNTAPYGGSNPTNTASRYTRFSVGLSALGNLTGYLVNSDATYGGFYSIYDFYTIRYTGGSYVSTPIANYCNALPSTSTMTVVDNLTGRMCTFNDGAPTTLDSTWSKMIQNGFVIKDDLANNQTKIGAARSTLALADVNGSTKAKVDATGLTVVSRLGFNSSTKGLSFGAGSPEGSVTAEQGSLYVNTSGGTGTTFYVKETGAGNTGWVAK